MARGRPRTPINSPELLPLYKPTIQDIHWLAGFYEGEGCCTIDNKTVAIQISQKQLWPLTKIRDLFGGKIYSTDKHPSGNVHVYKVNYERAIGIALTIFTLLSPEKREQIRQALNGNKEIKKPLQPTCKDLQR